MLTQQTLMYPTCKNLALLLLITAITTGCGQTGPLELPRAQAEKANITGTEKTKKE